jgi:hypothetical protein
MSATAVPRRATYATVVRENPDFRRIWIGQVGSLLGDWFNQVAILSLLLRLTGSGSAAALFWVLQMVPVFLVSPLAGRVVDHLPRKLVMIGADLARAAVVLAFLLVDRPDRIWIVYVATVIQMSLSRSSSRRAMPSRRAPSNRSTSWAPTPSRPRPGRSCSRPEPRSAASSPRFSESGRLFS